MKTKILMPFAIINVVLAITAAILIGFTQDKLLWTGVLLATASGPFYLMAVIGTGRVARTSAHLPALQLASGAGLLISACAFLGMEMRGLSGSVALGASIFGVSFVQWYVRVFSIYNRKKSPVIVKGQQLPELSLERLDGTPITSASFVGEKTLIVFFRGNWCPLCTAQLKEIRHRADRISSLGVAVRFISNQSVEKSRELTKKLYLPNNFEILYDRDLRAAKGLAIEDIDGTPLGIVGFPRDTVMATVIALDQEGRVIFGDQTDNYRVRPHPDSFLNVFDL